MWSTFHTVYVDQIIRWHVDEISDDTHANVDFPAPDKTVTVDADQISGYRYGLDQQSTCRLDQ